MKQTNLILIGLLALIIGAGAGFFAGMQYQKTQTNSQASQMTNRFGRGQGPMGNRQGGPNGNFRPVVGQVLSVDNNTLTVKLPDGSTKIAILGTGTTINKASAGTVADLTVGTQVAVVGNQNSDGSVTAASVQINPMFGFAGGRRQSNQGQKSTDAKEIVVTASNYQFSPNKITLSVGQKTRILLKNSDGTHDLQIEGLNLGTAVIQGGGQDWFEFTPDKAGTYQFFCSVDGHRQMGMIGTLTVQ